MWSLRGRDEEAHLTLVVSSPKTCNLSLAMRKASEKKIEDFLQNTCPVLPKIVRVMRRTRKG